MSSSQLTFIFFRGIGQPPTSHCPTKSTNPRRYQIITISKALYITNYTHRYTHRHGIEELSEVTWLPVIMVVSKTVWVKALVTWPSVDLAGPMPSCEVPGLVNIRKTMENHQAINGKTHYKWSFSIAMLKLPEAMLKSPCYFLWENQLFRLGHVQ